MAKASDSKAESAAQEMVVSVFDAKSVELKPGSKYLLLLRGDNIEAYMIQRLSDELKRLGFSSLVVSIPSNAEAVVIEQPGDVPSEKESKE